MLKVAASSLGYKHTEESIALFRGENHPMFGKTRIFSAETRALLSEAMTGEKKSNVFGPIKQV